jgi:hypothetical protein
MKVARRYSLLMMIYSGLSFCRTEKNEINLLFLQAVSGQSKP